MITLHIEHPVSDFGTWREAFAGFEEARALAGVRGHTIRQPLDDPAYILVDLEFDTSDQARAFEEFLRTRVWGVRANSPALAGAPVTRILEVRDSSSS